MARRSKRRLKDDSEGTFASLKHSKISDRDIRGELKKSLTERSWIAALKPVFETDSFLSLATFLHMERQRKATVVFPPNDDIWTALNICPLDKVKVVILGQDPYHGPNQAHGLSFSIAPHCRKLPPTLKNIYKELEQDNASFARPDHGYLLPWAQQHALLLNTILTVRQGKALSHRSKGWETVTDAILRAIIDRQEKPCVFLLWGKPAVRHVATLLGVDADHDLSKHSTSCLRFILSSHPSPLSATRTDNPFIGSRCFSRCNEALVELGAEPVDWRLAPISVEGDPPVEVKPS